jgi:hypothetical protein
MTKLIDRDLPLDLAEIGDPGREALRPSTLTVTVSPIFSPSSPASSPKTTPAARRYNPAHQCPRSASNFRAVLGIGDAAIALQHPLRRQPARSSCRRPDAVERQDTAAQHRHFDDLALRQPPCSIRAENPRPRRSGYRRRRSSAPVPAGCRSIAAQIAVDQRQRHQKRQAKPERQHHRGRQRAGAMDVADGKPQRRRTDARRPAGKRIATRMRDTAQHHERKGDGAEEGQRNRRS